MKKLFIELFGVESELIVHEFSDKGQHAVRDPISGDRKRYTGPDTMLVFPHRTVHLLTAAVTDLKRKLPLMIAPAETIFPDDVYMVPKNTTVVFEQDQEVSIPVIVCKNGFRELAVIKAIREASAPPRGERKPRRTIVIDGKKIPVIQMKVMPRFAKGVASVNFTTPQFDYSFLVETEGGNCPSIVTKFDTGGCATFIHDKTLKIHKRGNRKEELPPILRALILRLLEIEKEKAAPLEELTISEKMLFKLLTDCQNLDKATRKPPSHANVFLAAWKEGLSSYDMERKKGWNARTARSRLKTIEECLLNGTKVSQLQHNDSILRKVEEQLKAAHDHSVRINRRAMLDNTTSSEYE
jgi:hypothetical protein